MVDGSGVLGSNIQAIVFTNDHSASLGVEMDDILLIVCSKGPVMEPIYK